MYSRLKNFDMAFADGEANQSDFTDISVYDQVTTVKAIEHGDLILDMNFDSGFDLKMGDDLGGGLSDALGDASMDSFTDLTAMLTENAFLGQAATKEEEDAGSSDILDLDTDMRSKHYSFKRTYDEMDDPTSDLSKLSTSVGLARSRTPSLDHDYSTKRLRLSPDVVETDTFLVPDYSPPPPPSPTPSSSSEVTVVTKEEKLVERRQKNNLASKRSREIRKKKFTNMEKEAERLNAENIRLEQRVGELEKMAKHMKEILVTRLKIK